jgi:hypothetical protein
MQPAASDPAKVDAEELYRVEKKLTKLIENLDLKFSN